MTDAGSKKRLRAVLVAAAVAISVVVVLSAGLVGRSFAELSQVESGFQVDGRLTFGVYLPPSTYATTDEVRGGIHALQESLGGVPGVESVAYTSSLPITGDGAFPSFRIQGRPLPGPGERALSAQTVVVTPGYMQTMGIGVFAGRAFNDGDRANSPTVALINREAADTFWPGDRPVDQFLRFTTEEAPWTRIVGIVGNVRTAGLDAEVGPQIYVPFSQQQGFWGATSRDGSFIVRTAGDPLSLVPTARRAVREVDSLLPLSDIRTASDIVGTSLAQPRLISSLLGSFAAMALLLALAGVYGIVSHSVARRTREIGIRQALGAGRRGVLWLVVREGAMPALSGLAIGLVATFFVTGALADLLFQVSPRDPATFIAVSLALAAVAVLASWLPARRATRVPPAEALRGVGYLR